MRLRVESVELRDFRSYQSFDVDLAPGLTAIVGPNGAGKTNLVEAIGVVASGRSFRGALPESMIRAGAESGFVRSVVRHDSRELLVEIELVRRGRARMQVNRQRVGRARDLVQALNVTVFAPDDLEVIKAGPSVRRDFLDDLLRSVHPKNEAALEDVEKALRQRNALLRQCGGRLDDEAAMTLDVWDERFAELGERVAGLRRRITDELRDRVEGAYRRIAGTEAWIALTYQSSWHGALADALAAARPDDVRRGVSTVGPHRDDLVVELNDLVARTQSSQGEQRSLVLALRLASHEVVRTATGTTPVLILDDVLSELDDRRARSLLDSLPAGQTIITTATELPHQVTPELIVELGRTSRTQG